MFVFGYFLLNDFIQHTFVKLNIRVLYKMYCLSFTIVIAELNTCLRFVSFSQSLTLKCSITFTGCNFDVTLLNGPNHSFQ